MLYNKKIELCFSQADEYILNGQSKICNWLYNQLFSMVEEDYKNGSPLKLLSGRNLRNQVPQLKKEHLFLTTVHSSPTKNVALRLKQAYDDFFSGKCKHPHYRAFKKKWFSLYFDEPNKGFKVLSNRELQISLGKDSNNKQMAVVGTFKEPFKLNANEQVKTFRLCKQQGGRFYGIFTIERTTPVQKEVSSWIAIDQNHKNFFVAVDHEGNTFEFDNFYQDKYFDAIIDALKAKRDKCNKKHKVLTTPHGKTYSIPNKRWNKLNNALNKAYTRRREQIKLQMYAIAHYIAKHYDKVVIGNYVPSKAKEDEEYSNRAVINQSHIGEFRKVLEWVMMKSHKSFVKVSEKDTTKTCCVCGHKKKKLPNVRSFTCEKCGTYSLRDTNSAVNIAAKDGYKVDNPHLDKIDKKGFFYFKQQQLIVSKPQNEKRKVA